METTYFTKLELEIQNFVHQYGADALIKWLQEYSKVISQKDFNMFHRIQKFCCEEYDVPIADISRRNSTNIYQANTKKTISYLTSKKTNLQIKHIAMVQGCTPRTIYNHIQEVEFSIENPKGFKDFADKYNKIIKKLEHHANTNP